MMLIMVMMVMMHGDNDCDGDDDNDFDDDDDNNFDDDDGKFIFFSSQHKSSVKSSLIEAAKGMSTYFSR